jgi:hypothetical protein
MREKFKPFISFTAPRLFRLPGQSLRGLAGRRSASWRLARPNDRSTDLKQKTSSSFGRAGFLLAPRLFRRDTKLTTVYQGWQKTSHRDPPPVPIAIGSYRDGGAPNYCSTALTNRRAVCGQPNDQPDTILTKNQPTATFAEYQANDNL